MSGPENVKPVPEAPPNQGKKTPRDFLKSVIGKPVVVKLNSGVDYRGMSERVYASVFYTRVCIT